MSKSIKNILLGLVAITALAMVLSLSACSNNKNSAETSSSLYAQGLQIVQLMAEMTETEEYIELYTGSNEIKRVIQNISRGDYVTPKAVYAISVTNENLAAMVELDNLNNPSEELKNFLMQRVFVSLMTQLNGMSGVDNLAAASVCTVSKAFVAENVTNDVIYLYTYENALPVAVTFTVGENQAVAANGVFVMYDEFTCNSAEEIKAFFSELEVKVTEVKPEK